MALIGNGKCIDYEVLSKQCKSYEAWENKKATDVKSQYKGKKLSNNKGIGGGKGRLTNKVMNTLQNNYGMAIRQNTHNLYAMQKAVAVVLYHSTKNDDMDKRYQYCPRTTDSWCKYQSDKITGKNTYVERITINKAVSDVIAPIFSHKDLGSEALLSKCFHGESQNLNESLSNLIWTRCPKRIYVGNSVLKTAVASAAICYNDGVQGTFPVLTKLGIEHGFFTADTCRKADICRVKQANRKSTNKAKQRRKTLQAVRKGFNDKNEQEEGETYGSGAF